MPKKSKQSLRAVISHEGISDFHAMIKPEKSVDTLEPTKLVDNALLIYRKSKSRQAKWRKFLYPAFGNKLPTFNNTSQAAALLIMTEKRIIGFTFGHGRSLLDESVLEYDFGLRTAINLIDPKTLKSIDTHIFEDHAKHSRTQVSRMSSLDAFGVDINRDIMRSVTGSSKPEYEHLYRVSGSEASIQVTTDYSVAQLKTLADELEAAYTSDDYKTSFSWIDKLRRISDPVRIEKLDTKLIQLIKSTDQTTQNIHMAPPEPLDWEDIDGFSATAKGDPQDDLILTSLLSEIKSKKTLSAPFLKSRKVYVHYSGGDSGIPKYSVYKCLNAEVNEDENLCVLTSGQWFEVNKSFADEINNSISSIPVTETPFITAKKKQREDDYNTSLTKSIQDAINMDKQLVRCFGDSSSVEVCDVLTQNLEFIHVKKRKYGSSGLSHLFAQGRVSSELLLMDKPFLKNTYDLIETFDPKPPNPVNSENFNPSECSIIFAMIGASTTAPGEELPFFSKMTLHNTESSLRHYGYKVLLAGIGYDQS